MLEHKALPRADFLSFTAAGAPWSDFEWLSQLVYQAVYSLGAMRGLWLLKIVLLLATWSVLRKLLKIHDLPGPWRAAALALWSGGVLAHSDIRPELFSLLLFSLVLYFLERHRLDQSSSAGRALAAVFLIFALWSNLHAGFFFGLILFFLYAAVWAVQGEGRKAAEVLAGAALGAAGSLCNPYGLGPHRVAWQHWLMREELSRYIKEWHPMTFENPLHWPFWFSLGFSAALVLYGAVSFAARRGQGARRDLWPWAPVLAAAYFGASTLAHARVAAFFNVTAALLMPLLAREALGKGRFMKSSVWGLFLVYGAFLAWVVPQISWAGVFNYKYVPRQAAEFMDSERAVVEPIRVFNQWEWGGYLAWRLHPWYKVSGDGRYLFHPQLKETAEATSESGRWRKFMEERGFSGALLPNLDMTFPATKVYPDGTSRAVLRPWYLFYMPMDRWALVYWDAQALFFVERRSASKGWLLKHEYRYLRPKDEGAFDEALRRKDIPARKLAEERGRHERETSRF